MQFVTMDSEVKVIVAIWKHTKAGTSGVVHMCTYRGKGAPCQSMPLSDLVAKVSSSVPMTGGMTSPLLLPSPKDHRVVLQLAAQSMKASLEEKKE
jgi:hypothetical protein